MRKYTQLKISYVLPIYNEQKDLAAFNQLIATYSKYSRSVLKHIQFVFIDDHSPMPIQLPEDCTLNYLLARIDTNIPWNQGGARNLGAHLARAPKMILTDLDITFTEAGFQYLIDQSIPTHLHIFDRISDGKPIHPHFNTFFCSKSTYFKSFGVDEEFCGHYGHEDVFFLDLQKRLGTKIFRVTRFPVLHTEHKNSEKPQHNLVRDENQKRPLYEAKRRIVKDPNRDPFEAHSRLFLNFDWTVQKEHITLE
jgi:hypothetical protein